MGTNDTEDDYLDSGYQQFAVDATTARDLSLPDFAFQYRDPADGLVKVSPVPTFLLLPATDASRAFAAAQQRGIRRNLKPKHVTPDVLDQIRDEDRALYANHLVRGWHGIVDNRGAVIPFTQAAAVEFFTGKRLNKRTGRDEYKMPDLMFDAIRAFCIDAMNFTTIDVGTIAKK